MPNVTRIDDAEERAITAVLQDLLRRHENGQIKGIAFAIKTSARRHRIGLAGQYWDDPTVALGVVTRMEYKLNQIISSREGDPETTTMPL